MLNPRSKFASRLREYPEVILSDDRIHSRRGDWRDWFAHRVGPAFDGRVILEIGCATGEVLLSAARKHPTCAFIGIDWKCKAIFDAGRQASDAALINVALLRGWGQDIGKIFATGEVSEVWIFHPEPFPPSQRNLRIMSEPFLLDAHAALDGTDAKVIFKTDHAGSFAAVLNLMGVDPMAVFATGGRDELTLSASAHPLQIDLDDLPARSALAREQFIITCQSTDFWNDAPAQASAAERLFSGSVTPFETRYRRRRQPIHYIEMSKK